MCERKCILIWTASRKTWLPSSCLTLRTRVYLYTNHTICRIKRTVHHKGEKKGKCKSSQENKSFGAVQCYSMLTLHIFSTVAYAFVYVFLFSVHSDRLTVWFIYLVRKLPTWTNACICVKQSTYYLLCSYRYIVHYII